MRRWRGKSTLNRLEHAPPRGEPGRYHRIGHDADACAAITAGGDTPACPLARSWPPVRRAGPTAPVAFVHRVPQPILDGLGHPVRLSGQDVQVFGPARHSVPAMCRGTVNRDTVARIAGR